MSSQYYIQARLQARLANFADEKDWVVLNTLTDISTYMEQLKHSILAPYWLAIDEDSTSYEIERRLRMLWHNAIDEINIWLPKSYIPILNWYHILPYLPFLKPLLEAEEEPFEWMQEDVWLKPYLKDSQLISHDWYIFQKSDDLSKTKLYQLWLEQWQNLWLSLFPQQKREALVLGKHIVAIYQGRLSSQYLQQARSEHYQNYQVILRRFFHQNLLKPIIIFAYLGLIALDLYRLRAELLERLLFKPL